MEHAKKLVLVPEERTKQFELERLTELDRQMQNILKKNNLNDMEKAVLYQQVLQKYVKFPFLHEVKQSPDEQLIENSTESQVQKSDNTEEELNSKMKADPAQSDNIVEEIIHSAPSRSKAVAKGILDFMSKPGSSVVWTPDKELVINGKIIHNTNIVDLVNHLIRNKKIKPQGLDKFYSALMSNNLSPSFVKNRFLKSKTMYAKPISWEPYWIYSIFFSFLILKIL